MKSEVKGVKTNKNKTNMLASCSLLVYLVFMCVHQATSIQTDTAYNQVIPSCSKTDKICRFDFRVAFNVTMVHWTATRGDPLLSPIVFEKDGKFYQKDVLCEKTDISEKEVLSSVLGDGRYKRTMVINGQLPGPPIVVYKGQHVLVTVTNAMENEAMTIHWHGLHMKKTPWMDGGGTVSQCPILPGQIFQYRFEADETGTHWYHGHIGEQRTMGMAGPLVVLHRSAKAENSNRGDDVIPSLDGEFHMMLTDWSIKRSDEFTFDIKAQAMRFFYGYGSDKCYDTNTLIDGSESSALLPAESILINGKGRYLNPETGNSEIPILPLEVFKVKTGGRFRFRVTSAAMYFPFRVSIDEHKLHLVASDGSDIATTKAESVIISSGERFDFWIDTDDPTGQGNYWIRVETLDYEDIDGKLVTPIHAEAILRYEGALETEPQTSRKKCSFLKNCVIINCPYKFYPRGEHIRCKYITDLRKPILSPTLTPGGETGFLDKILSFQMGNMGFTSDINGRTHVAHGTPPQIFPKNTRMTPCNETECDKHGCACTNQLSIRSNDIVQLTFFSPMPSFPPALSSHPIHTHGHKFQVLKVGWPVYDHKTGKFRENNPDIDCSLTPGWCHKPRWADPSWENGKIPGLITEGAVEKDTVNIPAGGYVVVRFKADNPGYWLLHCHMEPHSSTGMLMVLKEGEDEEMVPVPEDFPQCDDYSMSDEEYFRYTEPSSSNKKGAAAISNTQQIMESPEVAPVTNQENKFMMLSVFLGIMLLAVMAVLGVVVYRSNTIKIRGGRSPRGVLSEEKLEGVPLLNE